MNRRSLSVLTGILLCFALWMQGVVFTPGHAQIFPPAPTPGSSAGLIVTPYEGPPGTTVSISAVGFSYKTANSAIIYFDGQVIQRQTLVPCGRSTTRGFGVACTGLDVYAGVPSSAAPGLHSFVAVADPESASAGFTVLSPPATPPRDRGTVTAIPTNAPQPTDTPRPGDTPVPTPTVTPTLEAGVIPTATDSTVPTIGTQPTTVPSPTASPTGVPTYVAGSSRWDAGTVIDGRLNAGWESATGAVSNQHLRLALSGRKLYDVTGIVVDPAATGGDTSDADVKNFQIGVASSPAGDDFTTLFQGHCDRANELQTFLFPHSVQARYLEFIALDNYGSPAHIAVSELEVLGSPVAGAAIRRIHRWHDLQSLPRHRWPANPQALGHVQYIYRGLSVEPPTKKVQRAKINMSLFTRYGLHTKARERASINFVDRTALHINQRTDVVLTSPNVTLVRNGEVNQVLTPGTDHQIQTASAIAAAIGTNFDVRVHGDTTVILVIEGAVLVRTPFGSVTVRTGERTSIRVGHAPTTPTRYSSTNPVAWTAAIPPPGLPLNYALQANGGRVVAVTSSR